MKKFFKWVFSQLFAFKRPFKLSKGGWIFVLYTIGIGAGSINTGNNLLYLIFGLFIGILIASGLLSDLSLWSLSVSTDFPASLEAKKIGFIGIKLVNAKKWLPSLSVTVELEAELRGHPLILKKYIPVIRAKESLVTHLTFVPETRGLLQLRSLRCTTSFPFGLIYKWWRSEVRTGADIARAENWVPRSIVTPAITPLSLRDTSLRSLGEELSATAPQKGDGSVTVSLGEFHDGDNPRRIHWRASAKRGQGLYVREMELDEKNETKVLWWALEDWTSVTKEKVEDRIEFTASLINAYKMEGKTVVLVVPESSGGDNTKSFIIRDRRPMDPYNSTMEFLSLFDAENPEAREAMAYLDEGVLNGETLIPIERLYEKKYS